MENPNTTNLQSLEIIDSDLHKCLRNQKWNDIFLKYSEQCFACEDIMFWNAVEQFKNVTAERLKRELFYNIYKTYIRIGAPLELNIARKDFEIPDIESQFNALCIKRQHNMEKLSKSTLGKSNQQQIPTSKPQQHSHNCSKYFDLSNEAICVKSDIFNLVQTCCEHNMRDNFNRFHLLHDKEISNEVGLKRIYIDDHKKWLGFFDLLKF